MFKNVLNLVKFKNQLEESQREVKKRAKEEEKKKKKKKRKTTKSIEREVTFQGEQVIEAGDGSLTGFAANNSSTKNGSFFVRQGRKRFSSMAERLRHVKRFSALATRAKKEEQEEQQQQEEGNSDGENNNLLQQVLEEKPKFVIDYEEQRLTSGHDDAKRHPIWDQPDSDDDDAYVSAEESFGDDDDDGDNCKRAQQEGLQTTISCAYDASNGKFIMPEELCDIPTFLNTKNCDPSVIEETRRQLRERHDKNPHGFYEDDYQRMLNDDWTVSRFLLRRRLDPKRTAQLMEDCGKFRRQYMMSRVQLYEFPAEFHLAGGIFQYAPDRVGNTTLYMRVKMYKRRPEISDLFKSLILCVLEQCDVSTGGRGTTIVFDLSEGSLQNVDLGFLYWLLYSFRNYCPKGVCYILVLNLPWFLSATAKLAMTWMSATNRRALRFVQGKEIEKFIAPENLPDYLGGTCKQDYRKLPAGSQFATSAYKTPNIDLSQVQADKVRELFKEILPRNYNEKDLLVPEHKEHKEHKDKR